MLALASSTAWKSTRPSPGLMITSGVPSHCQRRHFFHPQKIVVAKIDRTDNMTCIPDNTWGEWQSNQCAIRMTVVAVAVAARWVARPLRVFGFAGSWANHTILIVEI